MPSLEERLAAAENQNSRPEVLERLAADADSEVRTQVALNPNCPPDVLARLAVDPDENVRTEVACHPRTPIWVVERLAEHDPATNVRSWGDPDTAETALNSTPRPALGSNP